MQSDRSPERSHQVLLESSPQSQVLNRQRVLVVQYMGDYREAVERFDRGGAETYYAQRYSVNIMANESKKLPFSPASRTNRIISFCRTESGGLEEGWFLLSQPLI
jgi:hypothetical protein